MNISPVVKVLRISAELIGILIQLALVALGLWFVFGVEGNEDSVLVLVMWCLLGTFYGLLVTVSLRFVLGRAHNPPQRLAFTSSRFARIASIVTVFTSSVVGITAAFQMVVLRDDPAWHGVIEFVGVWAMLLSWAIFHWGYAQIYYHRFARATGQPPLEFPRTPQPLLTDFVYFSFTNGTNFSVSDVVVATSAMRWTVVWHTTISFFLNALIIVLAINTLTASNLLGP